MDWKHGDLTREQYRRMKIRLEQQAQQLQETIVRIQAESQAAAQKAPEENPYLTAFLQHRNIDHLSRGLLVELLNAVYVHEDKSIEIEFNFADPYRRIAQHVNSSERTPCKTGGYAV